MWKYAVAFAIFAGGALWLLSTSTATVEMGGEKHEVPAAAGQEKETSAKR